MELMCGAVLLNFVVVHTIGAEAISGEDLLFR